MLAYFDCFSGISGDMTLGALIDLGVPVQWLKESLKSVPISDFELSITSVSRHGIQAKRVHITSEDNTASRDFATIKSLINNSPLSLDIKQRSLEIFDKIADAEAVIHGCPKEHVHFHEVGGVDSIIDIVGTSLCLDYLGIEKIISSKIPLGKGFVSSQHGKLPIPAPATIGILKDVPVYGSGIPQELVTPTGAAIIVTLAKSYEAIPEMIVKKTGYGAGKRDLDTIPNVLRIIVGKTDTIMVLETCIDDMNPEIFGFLMDRLFKEGALDVYWVPVFMKKNRPGTMVQVLCRENDSEILIDCILSETSALGIRYYHVKRSILAREYVIVKTAYGEIQVKRVIEPGGNVRIIPEYEVCKKIAQDNNIPLRIVYETIMKSFSE
jgi:uncharacterized protein (TIGR00299 family) protein